MFEFKRLAIQNPKMTDAEIKKDLFYYAFNYRNTIGVPESNDWWLALERHVEELIATTREKVLAELVKENPPVENDKLIRNKLNQL